MDLKNILNNFLQGTVRFEDEVALFGVCAQDDIVYNVSRPYFG